MHFALVGKVVSLDNVMSFAEPSYTIDKLGMAQQAEQFCTLFGTFPPILRSGLEANKMLHPP